MGNLRILSLTEWNTPASRFRQERIGSAEIGKVPYRPSPNFYRMEGIRGYDYFTVKKPITLTVLKVDEQGWMIDDPLHWYGMQDFASAAVGKVLVAGLGLGLIVSALEEQDVESVDLVEINKDVIRIVMQYFSNTSCNVISEDFWKYLDSTSSSSYDTIILDMWTYGDSESMKNTYDDMTKGIDTIKSRFPSSRLLIWGIRDVNYNPAIKKTPAYLESHQ